MIPLCRYCEHSEDRSNDGLHCYQHAATVQRDDTCGWFDRAPGSDDDLPGAGAGAGSYTKSRPAFYPYAKSWGVYPCR